jgi:5-methylcytosine-specific restriction endonuclease McrA
MSEYLQKLADAHHIDEVDKGHVYWRKRTWVPTRGKTYTRLKIRRPPPETYYSVLRNAGVNLCVCVLCNSDERVTVHHRDGNPFNNSLENLQVLCWNCHLIHKNPELEGVHSELEGTKLDVDFLDDANVRGFYGIIQEE